MQTQVREETAKRPDDGDGQSMAHPLAVDSRGARLEGHYELCLATPRDRPSYRFGDGSPVPKLSLSITMTKITMSVPLVVYTKAVQYISNGSNSNSRVGFFVADDKILVHTNQ